MKDFSLLKVTSKYYGEFYCSEVDNFFEEGEKVTVYSHFSYRLYTIKNNKIFRIAHNDFGSIFFTKEEWRNKKLKSLLNS